MDKLQAVRILMKDTNNKRPSKASLKRTQNACKALGLSDKETRQIETDLEYREGCEGKLYPWYETK
jgi:hypothetical protein